MTGPVTARVRLDRHWLNSVKRAFGSRMIEVRRSRTGEQLAAQEIVLVPQSSLAEMGDNPQQQRGPVARYEIYGTADLDIQQGDIFAWDSQVENMLVEKVSSFAGALGIRHALIIDARAARAGAV